MEKHQWLNIARLFTVTSALIALIGSSLSLINSWIITTKYFAVIGALFAVIGALMVWYLTNSIGAKNKAIVQNIRKENNELKTKISNLKNESNNLRDKVKPESIDKIHKEETFKRIISKGDAKGLESFINTTKFENHHFIDLVRLHDRAKKNGFIPLHFITSLFLNFPEKVLSNKKLRSDLLKIDKIMFVYADKIRIQNTISELINYIDINGGFKENYVLIDSILTRNIENGNLKTSEIPFIHKILKTKNRRIEFFSSINNGRLKKHLAKLN